MKIAIMLAAAMGATSIASADVHESRRVPYGDLNLSSPEGAARFDQRLRLAGRSACRPNGPGLVDLDCLRRFRKDAVQSLPELARSSYLQNRIRGAI